MSIPVSAVTKPKDETRLPLEYTESPAAASLPGILNEARRGADWVIRGLQAGKVDSTFTRWAVTDRDQVSTVLSVARLRFFMGEQPQLFMDGAEEAIELFVIALKNWADRVWVGELGDMDDYYRLALAPALQMLAHQTNYFRYMPFNYSKRMFAILLKILLAFVDAYYTLYSLKDEKLDPQGVDLIESAVKFLQAFYSANPCASQEAFDELQASDHRTNVFELLLSLFQLESTRLNLKPSERNLSVLKTQQTFVTSVVTHILIQQLGIIRTMGLWHALSDASRKVQAIDDPEERTRALEHIECDKATTRENPLGRTYRGDDKSIAVCCYCATSERGVGGRKKFMICSSCGMMSYCSQCSSLSLFQRLIANCRQRMSASRSVCSMSGYGNPDAVTDSQCSIDWKKSHKLKCSRINAKVSSKQKASRSSESQK